MNPTLSFDVACRRVGLNRLDDLLSLEAACFETDRINRRNMRHLLSSPSACCIGAYADNLLAGDLVLLSPRNSRSARIYSLAVAQSFRGRGIGRELMLAAEEAALRRNCNRLRLEVRWDNLTAIRLYERLGFRQVKSIPGYYEDGANAVVMHKEISE